MGNTHRSVKTESEISSTKHIVCSNKITQQKEHVVLKSWYDYRKTITR